MDVVRRPWKSKLLRRYRVVLFAALMVASVILGAAWKDAAREPSINPISGNSPNYFSIYVSDRNMDVVMTDVLEPEEFSHYLFLTVTNYKPGEYVVLVGNLPDLPTTINGGTSPDRKPDFKKALPLPPTKNVTSNELDGIRGYYAIIKDAALLKQTDNDRFGNDIVGRFNVPQMIQRSRGRCTSDLLIWQ